MAHFIQWIRDNNEDRSSKTSDESPDHGTPNQYQKRMDLRAEREQQGGSGDHAVEPASKGMLGQAESGDAKKPNHCGTGASTKTLEPGAPQQPLQLMGRRGGQHPRHEKRTESSGERTREPARPVADECGRYQDGTRREVSEGDGRREIFSTNPAILIDRGPFQKRQCRLTAPKGQETYEQEVPEKVQDHELSSFEAVSKKTPISPAANTIKAAFTLSNAPVINAVMARPSVSSDVLLAWPRR